VKKLREVDGMEEIDRLILCVHEWFKSLKVKLNKNK